MADVLTHCHLIARMLSADGFMAETEREFLRSKMTEMGLSEEQQQAVMHFEGSDAALEKARSLPEDERRQIRDDLIQAAFADGRLTALEMQMMKEITAALGLEE